jgi:hypothetical protein
MIEYKCLQIEGDNDEALKDREKQLNALAKSGWRVVSQGSYSYSGLVTVDYTLVREER